jgi:hypothetical protein
MSKIAVAAEFCSRKRIKLLMQQVLEQINCKIRCIIAGDDQNGNK